MTPIFKCPLLGHIDLAKIVRITEPEFIDRMGSGGWFVGFTVDVQLRDRPIYYERGLTQEEEAWDHHNHCHLAVLINPVLRATPDPEQHLADLLCLHNLRVQIFPLLSAWQQYSSQAKH